MNFDQSLEKPVFFLAGAAHVDRRGRCAEPCRMGASNPGWMAEAVGGSVFNAAGMLRRLGAAVRLVSARGGDEVGLAVGAATEALGIDDLSMTWLDRPTATYTAILDDTGELVCGLADMALYDLLRPRVFQRRHIRQALASSDALMVDANLPAASIARLVEMAGEKPTTAIGVSPAKVRRLVPALPHLSAVFLSLAEAAHLAEAGDAPIEAVAERLAAAGCRRAVVTDGPRPAAILEHGSIRLQSPLPVSRLDDVTGAGDTLAAVASHALSTGCDFAMAARLGMAAASLSIAADGPGAASTAEDIRAIAAAMPPALRR